MKLTEAIMHDFKAGRLESFYQEVYPSLLTYAARLLSDGYAFLAEDCVQDCIFRSYQERDRITSPAAWKAFLHTSVHNAAVSILRHYQVHNSYAAGTTDEPLPDASASIIEQETLDQLYAAIDRLPEPLRRIFELSFEQGLTNQQIADALHLSLSGVKKQKARMLVVLRQSLSAEQLALLSPLLFL